MPCLGDYAWETTRLASSYNSLSARIVNNRGRGRPRPRSVWYKPYDYAVLGDDAARVVKKHKVA